MTTYDIAGYVTKPGDKALVRVRPEWIPAVLVKLGAQFATFASERGTIRVHRSLTREVRRMP